MSFAVWAALFVGVLVIGPILAHSLRLGKLKDRIFPPAERVEPTPLRAEKRKQPEDLPLLLVRVLMVLCLAVLGATPLLSSDRLSLDRPLGASLALSIVLDDSLSMQARLADGETRFERAREAAQDLISGLSPSDSVNVVLAGKPARFAFQPTRSPNTAAELVRELRPTDRETDLDLALYLAEGSLKDAHESDQRIVVLSDFAVESLPPARRPFLAPLTELRQSVDNCGIAQAERTQASIRVTVACTAAAAARGRRVVIKTGSAATPSAATPSAATPSGDAANALDGGLLLEQAGVQTVTLQTGSRAALDVALTGADGLAHDDEGVVATASQGGLVGVVCAADEEEASAKAPCSIEQGLGALGHKVLLLAEVPEDLRGLEPLTALVVDNPVGFSPEVRRALEAWLAEGGLGLVLVGNHAERASLGASLHPFVEGRIPWRKGTPPALDVSALAAAAKPDNGGRQPALRPNFDFSGIDGDSLGNLEARGRAELEGRLLSGSEVLLRWQDGTAWLVRRPLGLGVAMAAGLPSSVGESDFALRPGFLALLDAALRQETGKLRADSTPVGSPWSFGARPVSIRDPRGAFIAPGALEQPERVFVPSYRGRYQVMAEAQGGAGETSVERIAHVTTLEILTPPQSPTAAGVMQPHEQKPAKTDGTRYAVWALALLAGLEVGLRVLRLRQGRGGSRPQNAPALP